MDAQVAVIGTGTIGSMTLWQLARAGVDAIGFEQFSVGHDRSAAGGESRIFRTAYVEGPQYIPFLQRSLDLWRDLEQESEAELLTLTTGLTIGSPASPAITQVLEGCRKYGLAHEVLNHPTLQDRYPQHVLHCDEIGVVDPHAGFIKPDRAIVAAAEAARKAGARIITDTRIETVQPRDRHIEITSGERTWKVASVVVTVGPWITRMVPALTDHVVPHRLHLAWHPVTNPNRYAPEHSPVFMRDTPLGLVFGFPSLDGATVKVGLHESYADFAPTEVVSDPDRLDRTVDRQHIEALGANLTRYLDGLDPEPSRISTYMDGYTRDSAPVVGRLGNDNIWVLGGFSGHGFKMAPAFGEAAAQLVRSGESELPTAAFGLDRFEATVR